MKSIFLIITFLLSYGIFSQTTDISVNPNPFSKRAVVHYTVASADTITIDVFNQLGQAIVTVRSNYIISAGVYQDSLRMDTFPDGKYVIRIANLSKNLKTALFLKILSTGLQDANS